MTSSNYVIRVLNLSEKPQDFVFFNDAPKASKSAQNIWPIIWMGVSGVAVQDSAQFDAKAGNYAICGATPIPIEHGIKVTTAKAVNVELTGAHKDGTAPLMDVVVDGAQFVEPYGTTKKDYSFGIHTTAFDADRHGRQLLRFHEGTDGHGLTFGV